MRRLLCKHFELKFTQRHRFLHFACTSVLHGNVSYCIGMVIIVRNCIVMVCILMICIVMICIVLAYIVLVLLLASMIDHRLIPQEQ